MNRLAQQRQPVFFLFLTKTSDSSSLYTYKIALLFILIKMSKQK